MNFLSIDSQLFHRMVISAANCLENNKEVVNSLNVFPVPDGDTGTNMSMTMMSAVKEVLGLKEMSIENIAEAAAKGSLMGARGNSGVILSQLLRGFAKGVKGKETLDARDIAVALKEGANTAYKAVMKPTEGTILTVAREAADKALEFSKTISNIDTLLDNTFQYAQKVLDRTPEMLPVLKKAGVVDAGGKGFLYIFQGALEALRGNDVAAKESKPLKVEKEFQGKVENEEIKFGYCTEFIIKTDYDNIEKFKQLLSTRGDSLVVVGGPGIIKVHVHTNTPGTVLSDALELGELTRIKIDNMREQHRSILNETVVEEEKSQETEEKQQDAQPQKTAVITVAMGKGIRDIFLDLGASRVIEGGQTMNPSTEDILNAISSVNAEEVFILPNNGNIVMAAKQAAALSNKKVYVIPSKSIPQGISALTAFNPESESNENIEMMTSAMNYVKTGQVTYAVRDTIYEDREINQGDILGLINGKINNTGKNILDTAEDLICSMVSEDDELITILYGNDISEEDAGILEDRIQKKFPDCDIQVYNGGQPLYYFIISVE